MTVDIHKPDTSTLVTTGHFYFGWTVVAGTVDFFLNALGTLCNEPGQVRLQDMSKQIRRKSKKPADVLPLLGRDKASPGTTTENLLIDIQSLATRPFLLTQNKSFPIEWQ
jgi:hypothetical protein